jgi:hypothetical protein
VEREYFVSARPWLEVLKATVRECTADTDEAPMKITESLPSEGCERCETFAHDPALVATITAEKVGGSWGEEERRLVAAGWAPKERCGKIIWECSDNGFYYSQEVAMRLLEAVSLVLAQKRGKRKGVTQHGNGLGEARAWRALLHSQP